jgi:hypothetical protein
MKNRTPIEQVVGAVEDAVTIDRAEADGGGSFTDVPSTHPYYEAITGMAEAGIINGYTNERFGPEDSVKRAQFAKMIVGAMGLEVDESKVAPFKDLGPDDQGTLYPHDYIAVVAEHGITKGITATEFGPYKEITRAQVITMAIRAFENLKPGVLKNVPADYESIIPNFSDTHWQNLRKAEYNGLLIGLEAYFRNWDPWQNSTRGECAQVLYNLMTFERQEKQGADLVSIEKTYRESLPQEVQTLMDKKVADNVTDIIEVVAEHPVNAAKKVAFYLINTDDDTVEGNYFIQDKGVDRGYVLEKYKSQFAISYNRYKTWLSSDYSLEGNEIASIMAFLLGGSFNKLDNETPEMYLSRTAAIATDIEQLYGENGYVNAEKMKNDLKLSKEIFLANYFQGTTFSYKRDQGQGAAIDKIVDSL